LAFWQLRLGPFARLNPSFDLPAPKLKPASPLSAIFLGILAALVVSPCMTPALAGALGFMAENEDKLLGALALFCMGLGLSTPLMIVALLGKDYLPKAGNWMLILQRLSGFLLVGLGIWLLYKVTPMWFMAILWAIYTGFVAGYGRSFPELGDKLEKKYRRIITLLTVGLFLFTIWTLRPYYPSDVAHTLDLAPAVQSLVVEHITQYSDFQKALATAQSLKKPLLVWVSADWCSSCHELEKAILKDPALIAVLKEGVVAQVSLTTLTAFTEAWMQDYQIMGPPTLLFFNSQSHEMKHLRLMGHVKTSLILQHWHKAAASPA